jgi:alpha-D-xyloside xylohydrolase
MKLRALACLLLLGGSLSSTRLSAMPVTGVSQQADGALLSMQPGTLRLQVVSDDVIRVTYAAGSQLPQLKSYSVVLKPEAPSLWRLRQTPEAVFVETKSMKARVDRKTGAVEFLDLANRPILAESADGR